MTGLSALTINGNLPLNAADRAGRDPEQNLAGQSQALGVPGLAPLMALSSGSREVTVALVDGPVDVRHPGLVTDHIVEAPGRLRGMCAQPSDVACAHGTSVAGILAAKRGSSAPGLCPGCTLLVRPVFGETAAEAAILPTAKPEDLMEAITDAIEAGARLINLSIALVRPSPRTERLMEGVLNYAARRGVLTVAAAGNRGMLGGSAITRHQGVIPVVACDARGRPMSHSNLGPSIGRNGLAAPGDRIMSLAAGGGSRPVSGASIAAPLVTGTIALLWSEFPTASAAQLRHAMTRAYRPARKSIAPVFLDASTAYRFIAESTAGQRYGAREMGGKRGQ